MTRSSSKKRLWGSGDTAHLWLCLYLSTATLLLSACGAFASPPPAVKETALPLGTLTPTNEPSAPDVTPLPTSEAESPTTIPFADTFTPAGWTADGQLLGLMRRRAQVLVDASGNEQAQVWYPGAEAVGGTPTFSPDGQLLVRLPYSNSNIIELWRPAGEGALRQLSVPGGPINKLSFSPDSRLLAVGADDGAVSLLDLSGCATDSGECGVHLRTIQAHAPGATRAVFSPDASLLASEGADGAIRLWRVDDGSLVRTFEGHAVAFSPDGKSIVLQGRGNTLRLYRIEDGTLAWAFSNPSLDQPTFSPDGRYLAWVSPEGIHLAELGPKVVVHTREYPGYISRFSFLPDGTHLAWIEESQAVLWPVSLLLREPSNKPTMLESIAEPDIRTERIDPQTLFDSERGGEYLAGLVAKYELSSIENPFAESYTAKPVRFPSGTAGVLVNIGLTGKAPGYLFLFKEEGSQAWLVDWAPGPNGFLEPDFLTGATPAGNLETVELFSPASNHGQVLKAMNWGHAGTGLGETGFSLIEIQEDKVRFLFQGPLSKWTLRIAEGELSRNQYEFVDLNNDGVKEIVVEQSYCQVFLRDASWEEQFCEPYASETYRYNGVKYMQQPEDEGSTTTDTP